MIINDATKLGSGGSNLILETAGKVYIKVADRFYELDFKNQGNGDGRTISVAPPAEAPEIDMSQYVTKKYLRSTLTNYITQRGWEDIQETKQMLENALLDGFAEPINPITVETMQLIVGTESLQFDFIDGLLTGNSRGAGFELMEGNSLRCPDNFIKHYTLDGPSSVRPDTPIQYYSRWTVKNTSDDSNGNTYLEMPEDDLPYYVYIRAPKYINKETQEPYTDSYVEEHLEEDPKGSGIATYIISQDAIELETNDDSGYYYFLVAIVTSKSNGFRSIGYMNGFTEIVPGQITAYVFKTPDGTQYLDFLNEQFKIGNSESGLDWNVTAEDTLTVKGNMEVIGGPLREELDELEGAISNDYLKKVIKDGRTTVQGGLLLSNIIALGHSSVEAQDPNYWRYFVTESGISGICTNAKYNSTEGYYDIAAWFGGSMKDLEKDTIISTVRIDTDPPSEYSRKELDDISKTFYTWRIGTGVTLYTLYEEPPINTRVYIMHSGELAPFSTISESGSSQMITIANEDYTVMATYRPFPMQNKIVGGVVFFAWRHTIPPYDIKYTNVFPVTTETDLYSSPGVVDTAFTIESITFEGWYIKVVDNSNAYIRQNFQSSIKYYAWENSENTIYTGSLPPISGKKIWTNDDTLDIGPYTIISYDKGYANSIFRMNGSGYLAGGDISWDKQGNLKANQLTVNSGYLGGLKISSDGISSGEANPAISIQAITDSSNNKTWSAVLSNAEIHGSLSTRIKGNGEDNFISLATQEGDPIIRINGSSLDTTSIPTFAYLYGGTLIWSFTSGDWFTYHHWEDVECQILRTIRAVKSGTFTIPSFKIYYYLYGRGMNPWATLKIYVKSWDSYGNEIHYEEQDFGILSVSSGNPATLTRITQDIQISVTAGRSYALCLATTGALESGMDASTGFRVYTDSDTIGYITYDSGTSTGLFMGANGINIQMSENSCLTYLVPKVNFSGGNFPATDPRGQGGIFKVMLPTQYGTNVNDTIGIEIQGYKNPSGSYTTPAFRINLGDGWKQLTADSQGVLHLS